MRPLLVATLASVALLPDMKADANEAGFDCVINPAIVVRIGSPVSGLIDAVHVDRGDTVAKGQEVARLRSEIEQANVALRREEATSQAEVEAQRARLELSTTLLERTEQLVARKVSAAGELDRARAEVEVIKRELAMAEMRQRIAGLELERAESQLGQRSIVSPIDGVVTERALFAGEFLHQEAHVVTIAQLDPLFVEAFLPVDLYDSLTTGMTISVLPNPPVSGRFEGKVEVIDRVFDAASSTFGVRIHLDNRDLAIPAGHRCKLRFAPS